MRSASVGEFRNYLVEFLDNIRQQSIVVNRRESPVAVLLSYQEYLRLIGIEKTVLLEKSAYADRSGYIGTEKSAELLKAGLGETS